jgi:hypothetical protein
VKVSSRTLPATDGTEKGIDNERQVIRRVEITVEQELVSVLLRPSTVESEERCKTCGHLLLPSNPFPSAPALPPAKIQVENFNSKSEESHHE